MTRRGSALWLLPALALAATLSLVLPAATLAGSATPGIATLFERAVKRVHADPDFSRAVMLEASGMPRGDRPVRRAGKIRRWDFVLSNARTRGSRYATAMISHRASSGFGPVQRSEYPWLGDVPIANPPAMSLRKAVSLLEKAGHRRGFYNVTLRRPLGPQRTAPLYIFSLPGGRFVAVNTKSGRVRPIR